MSGMDEMLAFLRARLDEDEAAAKAADPGPWHVRNLGRHDLSAVIRKTGETPVMRVPEGPALAQLEGGRAAANSRHVALHDPDRALREVATWRRIILEYSIAPGTDTKYGGTERETGFRLALSFALKAKALEWKDHPDWREWAS